MITAIVGLGCSGSHTIERMIESLGHEVENIKPLEFEDTNRDSQFILIDGANLCSFRKGRYRFILCSRFPCDQSDDQKESLDMIFGDANKAVLARRIVRNFAELRAKVRYSGPSLEIYPDLVFSEPTAACLKVCNFIGARDPQSRMKMKAAIS